MAILEVRKDGQVVRRQAVSDAKARAGVAMRVGANGRVEIKLGETKTAGGYEMRLIPGDSELSGDTKPYQTVGAAVSRDSDSSNTGRAGTIGSFDTATMPRIDGYTIRSKLGEGGMGTVWRATQLAANREVALKLMSARAIGSDKARRRFEREVQLSARLEHPGIARLYDSGLYKGVYFYAMEFIEGSDLDRFVDESKLGVRDILALLRKVCLAVDHAHRRGVIHRDLKPSNIMVTPDGEPHVVDFGLARTFDRDDKGHTISIEGDVSGTPVYMSPEQAAGDLDELDARTDVYSLGVIGYRLLTRSYPYDTSGTTYALLKRIIEGEVRSPRTVSASGKAIDSELEAVLLKALATDKNDRYAGAAALADDFDRYLRGDPVNAKPATLTYHATKKLRKHAKLVSLICGATAMMIGIGALAWFWIAQEQHRTEEAQRLAEESKREADRQTVASAEKERRAKEAEAQTAGLRRVNQARDAYNRELAKLDQRLLGEHGGAEWASIASQVKEAESAGTDYEKSVRLFGAAQARLAGASRQAAATRDRLAQASAKSEIATPGGSAGTKTSNSDSTGNAPKTGDTKPADPKRPEAKDATPAAPAPPPTKLTQAEAMQRLEKAVSVNFEATKFANAVAEIGLQAGLNITVQWETLQQVGVEQDKPVTLSLKNSSASAALTAMCGAASVFPTDPIEIDIVEGVVVVTTRSRLTLTTEIHDVRDLVRGGPASAERIVSLIQQTIGQNDAWDVGGGSYTLRIVNNNLVVKAPARYQTQVKTLLKSLRQAGGR